MSIITAIINNNKKKIIDFEITKFKLFFLYQNTWKIMPIQIMACYQSSYKKFSSQTKSFFAFVKVLVLKKNQETVFAQSFFIIYRVKTW
jgi:hypothetical protein